MVTVEIWSMEESGGRQFEMNVMERFFSVAVAPPILDDAQNGCCSCICL